MVEINKDILSNKEHKELENNLTKNTFPWFFEDHATNSDELCFFSHCFYRNYQINSSHFLLIEPLIKYLKASALVHIRANLNYNANKVLFSSFHRDNYGRTLKDLKYKTAIYYVNTNNGYTELKNKEKIKSVSNSLAIFASSTEHRVVTQTDSKYRLLININYF